MFTGFMVDASNLLKFGRKHDSFTETASVEFWIFKPQKNGQQVHVDTLRSIKNYIFQFAMFSLDFGDIDNKFMNFLEMNELVLPFKWHSFCISLSSDKALVYHNGEQQGVQTFNWRDNPIQMPKLNSGLIGGSKFKGTLADFQVFERALSENELSGWTRCQIQGNLSTFFF